MSERPKPTWAPVWLACGGCGHKWDDWQPIGVPIDSWIGFMTHTRCPSCGAGPTTITLRSMPLDREEMP